MVTTVEISTDERFASSLPFIKKQFKQTSIIKDSNKTKLYVCLDQTNFPEFCALADALTEIIITDMKSHYIESHLRLPIENPINKAAFIKALSSFDTDTDRLLARSLIKLTPDEQGEIRFLLDSFYEFKLDDLKERWKEVCVLANENICFLVCTRTFSELLRFLISNIDSLADEAHVFAREGCIEILDRGLRPFNVYINETLPSDIQTVTKLIAIAPKRIFLHQSSAIAPTLISNIQNLFGACVIIN